MKKLILIFISIFLILSGNIVVKAEELNEKIIRKQSYYNSAFFNV